MAKGTVILFFFLGIIAALLVGINIGKNIAPGQSADSTLQLSPTLAPTLSPSDTPIPIPSTTAITPSVSVSKAKGATTIYKDQTCGVQLSFPSSYLSQKTQNNQSVIFTNPDDQNDALAIACAKSIPKPPVAAENIEAVTLDKIPGLLYHDQNQDGTPRDEIIVKNPDNGMEIIIAGFGVTFQNAVKSFKFL